MVDACNVTRAVRLSKERARAYQQGVSPAPRADGRHLRVVSIVLGDKGVPGFATLPTNNRVVGEVDAGGPAEASGLFVGDELVKIGGIDAARLSKDAVRQLLSPVLLRRQGVLVLAVLSAHEREGAAAQGGSSSGGGGGGGSCVFFFDFEDGAPPMPLDVSARARLVVVKVVVVVVGVVCVCVWVGVGVGVGVWMCVCVCVYVRARASSDSAVCASYLFPRVRSSPQIQLPLSHCHASSKRAESRSSHGRCSACDTHTSRISTGWTRTLALRTSLGTQVRCATRCDLPLNTMHGGQS
jgi:hypothetical protein